MLRKSLSRQFSAGVAKCMSTQSATVSLSPNKYHRLEPEIPSTAELTSQEALQLYRDMAVIRRMETVASNLYKSKVIRGFCHLYSGQEAIAVGMKAAMAPQDSVITAYRAHGWTYMMGVSVEHVLAELTGRRSGCSRGKGGSMHTYAPNFYGGNGIVGAQVPLGAGVALKHQYSGDGGVNIALYGDGAANQGQVFEAYNIAALWKLPVIFVCENNKFGMGTSMDRSSASVDYYTRGDYIPGIWVDGMDVVSVRESTKWALNYCRTGNGPLVMEMETYRYFGHSMSDPGTSYRTREDVQEIRKTRDPITGFKARLLDYGLATDKELSTIDAAARKEVEAASEAAKNAPEPDESMTYMHVHTTPYEVRGADASINYHVTPTNDPDNNEIREL